MCQHVILLPRAKFRVIGQYSAEKPIFNMASVRHIGFDVMSSYCILELQFMFLTLL